MQTNVWFCTIHVYWTTYLKGHLGSKVSGSFTPVIYEHLPIKNCKCFKDKPDLIIARNYCMIFSNKIYPF